MRCPYPDCTKNGLGRNQTRCPQCSRTLAPCRHCGELNRAFASFCRGCGRPRERAGLDWEGFKGGPERRGLNPFDREGPVQDLEEVLAIDLKDRCRGLLICEDHLIAVSLGGRVEVIDIGSQKRVAGWKAVEPVTCEPCVHQGSLYLGTRHRVTAYTLGALVSRGPQLEPRWERQITGTPIQALLAFDHRLYLNVGYRDKRPREIQLIDDISGTKPTAARTVHAARRLSTPSGSVTPKPRVFFLSEENGRLTVHRADHDQGSRPAFVKKVVSGAPSDLKQFIPIASVGERIFAVFGDEANLCSIDAVRGVFGIVVREDVQNFALSGSNDGVLIQGGAMFFLYNNCREALTPDDRINGPPLLVGNRAAFVGMKDGRLRWYDLSNPAVIGEKHLSDRAEEVTSLASFRDYLVAGGSRGTVRLYRLMSEKSPKDRE